MVYGIDGRTIVPYPTKGPGDGRTWAQYFLDYAKARDALDEAPPERTAEVLVRQVFREGFVEGPNPLKQWAARLKAAGFRVLVATQTLQESGGEYGATAQKAGEQKPDRIIESWWLSAYKPGKGLVKLIYRGKGGGKFTCEYRRVNNELREISDKELREWVSGEGHPGD